MVSPDRPVKRSTAIWLSCSCSREYCAEASDTLTCMVPICNDKSSAKSSASAQRVAATSANPCTRKISAATCSDVSSEVDAYAAEGGPTKVTANAAQKSALRCGPVRAKCCNRMTKRP